MPNRGVYNIGKRTLLAKTCVDCGELKQGDDYSGNRAYKRPDCKTCHQATVNATDKRRNDESQKTAKNRRNLWTEKEVKTLGEYVDQGLTYAEIAPIMGRSEAGLRQAKSRYVQENE